MGGNSQSRSARFGELNKSFCDAGKSDVQALKNALGNCRIVLADKTVHAILDLATQLAGIFDDLQGISQCDPSGHKISTKEDAPFAEATKKVEALCESLAVARLELDKKLPQRTKARLRLEADIAAIKATSDRGRAMKLLEEIEAIEGHEKPLKAALAEKYGGTLEVLAADAAKVDAPFKKITAPAAMTAFMKNHDQWARTAKDALAYIFDDRKYPVPEKAKTGWIPGRDIQTNQAIVEGRVQNTIAQWNRLGADFLSLMDVPVQPVGSPGQSGLGPEVEKGLITEPDNRKMGILTYNILDPSAGSASLVKNLSAPYNHYAETLKYYNLCEDLAKKAGIDAGERPEPSALAISASALCAGDFQTAEMKRPAKNSGQAAIFTLIGNMYLLSRSTSLEGDWKDSEQQVLLLSNLYRLAFGLSPMQGNRHIQAAAIEHSQWQKSHKQMTHYRPEKAMATFANRMSAAQYAGPGCTENISGYSGAAAFWTWRSDAGHHRNLIRTQSRAAGIAGRGMLTYDTGGSTENEGLDKAYSIVNEGE